MSYMSIMAGRFPGSFPWVVSRGHFPGFVATLVHCTSLLFIVCCCLQVLQKGRRTGLEDTSPEGAEDGRVFVIVGGGEAMLCLEQQEWLTGCPAAGPLI